MKKDIKTSLHEELKEMPTTQLDELLQKELQNTCPDDCLVRTILEELQQRESGFSEDLTAELLSTQEKCQKAFEGSGETSKLTSSKKRFWGIAAAMAIFLVFLFMPQTVGAESVFQVVCRWTANTLELLGPNDDHTPPENKYVFTPNNDGLQKLYDEVVALGVTSPAVPMWLPDGFELTELKSSSTPDGKKVYAVFTGDKGLMSFSYFIGANAFSTQLEWEKDVHEYEISGINHIIFSNKGKWAVVWKTAEMECSIFSCLNLEETRTIVKSIYRRIQ